MKRRVEEVGLAPEMWMPLISAVKAKRPPAEIAGIARRMREQIDNLLIGKVKPAG